MNTYLIFGGTGTVGNILTDYFLKQETPDKQEIKVIIYSRDEYKQFYMRKKYQEFVDNGRLKFIIGDIKSPINLHDHVDYVIQAAALKHVSSCSENPKEAIDVNYHGNQNVIDYCLYNDIKRAVYITTDKAVNPINVYGMTKQLAEHDWIQANMKKDIFKCVRFGNIFGSRGSAVEYFLSIKNNQYPISHPDSERYFVTNDEVVALVNEALTTRFSKNFIVGIYKRAWITDIVKAINPLAQFRIVGLRDGEKIKEDFEEGFVDGGVYTKQELIDMVEEYKKNV